MPALYYLNPRLTLEDCKKLDEQRAANLKEITEKIRKNAESLPPELRSQYTAAMTPLLVLFL